MKKWLILMGVFFAVLGIAAFNSKFYYPALPIESMSKKQVLDALNDSSEDIVKIAEENGYEWFITRAGQENGYENVKKMIRSNGWEFQEQEGSGYFFEKDEKTLIASTEMWTAKFIIVQIPEMWDE